MKNLRQMLQAAWLACFIFSVIGIAIPMTQRAADNADRKQCLENLRRIGQGIQEWQRQHDYALPPGRGMSGFCNSTTGTPLPECLYAIEPGLNALWDKGHGVITDVSVFRCPADKSLTPPPQPGEDFTSATQLSYGMTGFLFPTDFPNKVIVADKSDKQHPQGSTIPSPNHDHKYINVLFFDGSVRTVDGPYLPPGMASELGSIYIRETGDSSDTFIE